jgi:hypothetical protein
MFGVEIRIRNACTHIRVVCVLVICRLLRHFLLYVEHLEPSLLLAFLYISSSVLFFDTTLSATFKKRCRRSVARDSPHPICLNVFHLPCINYVHNIQITNKMHTIIILIFNCYGMTTKLTTLHLRSRVVISP